MNIAIKLLNGFHASQNRESREWPPTPSRLFSALVNGYYQKIRAEDKSFPEGLEALKWLEKQTHPDILCGNVTNHATEEPIVYVPLNSYETGKAVPFLYNIKQKRKFPVVHPSTPFIFFSWNIASPHWNAIAQIVPYISYFGTSRSQAILKVIDQLPEDHTNLLRYTPNEEGENRISSYYEGRFQDLEDAYASDQIIPGQYIGYSLKKKEYSSLFQSFDIRQLTGPYKILDIQAPLLASALRSELLRLCSRLGIETPTIVAKDEQPHLSYMPLPFSNTPHGTGVLMGVGFGIPKGVTDAGTCLRALSQFRTFSYREEQWTLTPITNSAPPKTLTDKYWTGPSTTWKSVTPAELKWKTNNQQQIIEQCQALGLPAVVDCKTHAWPNFEGSRKAGEYITRNEVLGRQTKFLTHLKVEFEQPIIGPISLGYSRNFGLGLMRPVRAGM